MGQTPSVDALMRAIEQSRISPSDKRAKASTTNSIPTLLTADKNDCMKSKNDRHMDSVARFFAGLNHTDVFEYCLGFDKPGAPPLAERVVLIALQCGTFTEEQFLMDIGLHVIERDAMRHHLPLPGPHSANLLKSVAYHHLRIQPNARYANLLENAITVENNHFGATRFVDGEEANTFLKAYFARRIKIEPVPLFYDTIRDEYAVAKSTEDESCPIILLNFDEPQLNTLHKTFRHHQSMWKNVVATITTRKLAHEQGFDWRNNPITLTRLSNDLGISHLDSGTAADHAAYSLIAAVQMVMRSKFPLAKETLLSVVNTTMIHSLCLIPDCGKENFCTRCAQDTHRRQTCKRDHAAVTCSKCTECGRHESKGTHTTMVCPW